MYSSKIEENMEKLINSDIKMFASKTFDDILSKIKNSNLNFHLQLSPFSAVISLKKSFVCDKLGSPFLPNPSYQLLDEKVLLERNLRLESEFTSLKSKYDDLAQQFSSACETISNLEGHIIHYQKAAQVKDETQGITDELRSKIGQLEEHLEAQSLEICDLKNSNARAEEVAIRLNKELNDIKVRNKEDKNIM